MDLAKINVLIVTYKQADVIGRNIESILQQKEYGLNKIIICDDCSPDNNWDVIQKYVKQYPDFIVAYRNENNLGIYGNSMRLASLHDEADLYCWLEGDDELCDGFFKATQDYIRNNDIDVGQSVGIFSDYYVVNPQGKKKRVRNDFVLRGEDPLGAYYRNIATWRASLISKPVIEKFKAIEINKGLILAETLFDSQWFRYTDRSYYNPIVGSVYYSGIGVSVQWGLLDIYSSYNIDDNIIRWNYLIENDLLTDQRDTYWAQSNISYSLCLKEVTWKHVPAFIHNYKKGLKDYRKRPFMLVLKTCHLMLIVLKRKVFRK